MTYPGKTALFQELTMRVDGNYKDVRSRESSLDVINWRNQQDSLAVSCIRTGLGRMTQIFER